jgi:hypothetical protein
MSGDLGPDGSYPNAELDDLDPHLRSALEAELNAQNPSVTELLQQLVKAQLEQVRIASHQASGYAPLSSDGGQFVKLVNVQVCGSLNKFQMVPGSAVWTATDSKALFPSNMSAEDRAKSFPGGKALVATVKLVNVKNTFPCQLAVDLNGLPDSKNTTAGNGTTHHFIVPALFESSSPIALAGFMTDGTNALMEQYPGYTAENLDTHGIMTDARSPDVCNVHKNHPAISVLIESLSRMGAQGERTIDQILAAVKSGEYLEYTKSEIEPAINRAKEIFKERVKVIDLSKFAQVAISRPGLPFNSTEDLVALPEHHVVAALNIQPSMMSRDIKPVAPVTAANNTLMGHLAAKGNPAVSAAALASSTSVESQTANTSAHLLKTQFSLNLGLEISYRSIA